MHAGDKAFVVSFDLHPQMIQNWSPNLGDLTKGLAKLRADESTALYDAIAFSLYDFVGVRGRRALVVVTDGRDTASKLSFEQTLEYARRAGVPVYGIGIGIPPTAVDVRYNFGKLCSETGGSAYYIGGASDLKRIYDEIQSELRSQYVLSFYPPGDAAPKWHEVTVQVRGASAKTIRGYYP
jgi:VWFA-related protein